MNTHRYAEGEPPLSAYGHPPSIYSGDLYCGVEGEWLGSEARAAKNLYDMLMGDVHPRSYAARASRGEDTWGLDVQPYRASLSKLAKELFFVLLGIAHERGFPPAGEPMRVSRRALVDGFHAAWATDVDGAQQGTQGDGASEDRRERFANSVHLSRALAELSSKRVPLGLWGLPMCMPDAQLDPRGLLSGEGGLRTFGILSAAPVFAPEPSGDGYRMPEGTPLPSLDVWRPEQYRPLPEALNVFWDADTQAALEAGLYAFVSPNAYVGLESGWEQAAYRVLAEQLRVNAHRQRFEGRQPGFTLSESATVFLRVRDVEWWLEGYMSGAGYPAVLELRRSVLESEGRVRWLKPALDSLAGTGLLGWAALPPACVDEASDVLRQAVREAAREDEPYEGEDAVIAFSLALEGNGSHHEPALQSSPDEAVELIRISLDGEVARSLRRLLDQPGEDEATDRARWVW